MRQCKVRFKWHILIRFGGVYIQEESQIWRSLDPRGEEVSREGSDKFEPRLHLLLPNPLLPPPPPLPPSPPPYCTALLSALLHCHSSICFCNLQTDTGLDTHCAKLKCNATKCKVAQQHSAMWLRVVSGVCVHWHWWSWSWSIPKARWRSRRVVTQLARPLLSTGQNNYVLEWKPSLQGRDGPRNGCKRYLGMSPKYLNIRPKYVIKKNILCWN